MNYDWLPDYLATRRLNWPYESVYHIENAGAHRFVAWVGDELAGLSWAEAGDGGPVAASDSLAAAAADAVAAGFDDTCTAASAGTAAAEARMRMTLKPQFAEYGIGTELLALLMANLQSAGYDVIRYEIDPRYYSVQIYRNLGFVVDRGDSDHDRAVDRGDDKGDRAGSVTNENNNGHIRFVWRRGD
ncbi:MAG: hypothetical protein IJH91_00105 [Mogibacterium sp.]|nr:hypothetical protein [Mogibacterium sp.]